MNNEEQFKNNLNQLLKEKDFPFEQEQWSKMASILDSSKRRRRLIVLLFSFGIIALLGGLYYTNNRTNQVSETQAKNLVIDQHKDESKHEQIETPIHSAPASKKTLNVVSKSNAPNQEIKTKLNQTQNLATNTLPLTTKPVSQKLPPNNLNPLPSELKLEQTKSKNAPPIELSAVDTESEPKGFANQTVGVEKGKEISKNTNALAAEKQNNGEGVSENKTKEDLTGNQEQVTDIPSKTTSTTLPILNQKESTLENNQLNTATEHVSDNKNTDQNEALTTTNLASIATEPTTVQSQTQNTSSVVSTTMRPDTDYVKHKKILLFAEAGVSYLAGWKDPAGRDGDGINPAIGLQCVYKALSEFEIGLGLMYTSTSHLLYSNYVATVSRLDLGLNSKVTSFVPNRIHYIASPIRFYNYFKQGSAYGLGVTPAYLLTVDSKVEEYNNSINGVENKQSYKVKGYTQGFNEFDLQIGLYFKQKIKGRWWAQAELMYGLRDIKTGAYLHSSGFERNSGLRILIQYNLSQK